MRKFGLLALAAVLITGSFPAFASISKHPAEVYAATTDDGSELEGSSQSAPQTINGQITSSSPAQVAVQSIAAPKVKAKTHAQIPGTKVASLSYDKVPSDQTDSIAKRLTYVEYLIRKHNRAYDYRSHTLKELQAIVTELDGSNPPKPEQLNPAPSTNSDDSNL